MSAGSDGRAAVVHDSFDVFGLAPADAAHPGTAVATARAGGIGLLDLEFSRDDQRASASFERLLTATDARIGLRVDLGHSALAAALLSAAGDRPLTLIFTGTPAQQASLAAQLAPGGQHRVLAEIIDVAHVGQLPFAHHGIVAKGHEAGGWVGADTSYILAQKLLGKTALPVIMQGGIGVHSAAALRAMGAAGVVFEDQLLLLAESPLPETQQNELARLNGAETRLFGELIDLPCRVYSRPGTAQLKAADADNNAVEAGDLAVADWRARLTANLGWNGGEQFLPIGQGIGMAATYRSQYRSVGRFIQAVRRASTQHVSSAVATGFMAPGGALAKSHGTTYPIAQGPMTRVSDSPEFAYQVSKNGALPFLALALYRGPQVLEMLQQTKAKMTQADGSELPWGVGMLGFVPHSLREEQIAAVWQCKPTYALIAGGRPDQAALFEKEGIPTYIHAPAPALLRMYIEQGAKRFVFEGRECGGHIGPLASFPLWEQMIEVLLADVKPGAEAGYHILFAGGIHNAASGAMLAALAAPLAARGMKVGCIMGTAYLFTQEIVDSGAVVKGFRDAAISCDKTVNFETGPGHSTRCVDTPFFREFRNARKELLREGVGADELRDRLEDMNMGRMRVASKGLNRDASGQIVEVSEADQYKDGMFMIGQIATLRDEVITLDALHREVTEGGMAMLHAVAGAKVARKQEAKPSDIAIVGLGTLLPKATLAEKYWENILDQVCVIGEVPKDRWDWKMYFDADRRARDKVYSRWGGFLDEVAFDPISYGIPPKSMKSIDPMQLLTLEVARRALADAGMADGDYDRENTSIVLGAGGGLGDLGTQYAVRAELPRFVDIDDKTVWERLPEWTEESFAGTLLNVAAGRVSNRMDFGGLNFTVDAACASSLAAISIAVNELEAGRTNVAIAGGIDTVQSPFGFLCFSKTQALSPDGKPRTFDQNANGIAISEGLAVVVLKRLADAEAAGDRIYAVIKSVAGSSDGRALGLTAPRPEGQKLALKRAYARAGFSPATLGMAEAHGTGTPVGDKAEARTITESLAAEGAAPKTVAISSVKTLLGHTKASAGVSGLIKVALSLYHRTLPAHYGVEKPIDTIADPNAPVYLLKDARPWIAHPDHPRRGGVSAFGFGGTNFHAVLEEYCGSFGSSGASGAPRWPQELFVFRAKDEATLAADLGRFVTALKAGSNLKLRDLAHALARQAEGRVGSPVCLALVARDFSSLQADLDAAIASLGGNGRPLPQSVRYSKTVPGTPPQLGFLFPGQGAQYVNMGRETALYVDELRSALEFADLTLRAEFPGLLSRTILPPATFDAEAEQAQLKALTDTRVAQPSIGALALGYTRLAERLGLRAAAAAGHSYGEYAALHAAGALTARDFLKLSAVRGQCMAEAAATSEKGAMAAIQAKRDVVAAAIAGIAGVKIANHNAPEQAVISGPAAGVEQAAKALEASGVRVTRLAVSGAFHTELVASAQTGLSAAIAGSAISAPRYAVYANTTGKAYPADAAGVKRVLDGHLLNSVEFVTEIETMYADGVRVFVELGPKGTCANMARATLAGRDAICVSLDGNGGGLRGLLLGLAELVVAGVPVALARLFDGRDPQPLDLSKLAELLKPDVIPKHAWWVSGGCARAQDDALFRTGSLPAYDVESLAAEQAKLKAARTVIVQAPAAAAPVSSASAAAPHAVLAANPALGSEALAAYQQTMRQFLQLQERVLSQYLGGAAAGAVAPALPTPIPAPVLAAAPAVPPVVAATPSPVMAPPAAAARVEAVRPAVVTAPVAVRFDAAAALLEIVAERTGYPQDMLGLDQDLEAELGIDSIKRVEILGAFQKALPAEAGEAMQAGMERYTRARSLTAILDTARADLAAAGTAAVVPAAAPAAAVSVAVTVNAAPAIDRAQISALLLSIVAERTGYPTEMLGLDQDLEAELGIDSIKRVEILGALQKALPAAVGEAMQAGMERFTRARSLNAILDAALALLPAGSATSAPVAVSVAVSTAAPVAAFDRTSAQALLLGIVAERTGYPTDMLGLDQDLEAELGIDSIKRVEILGALQKALPAAQGDAMQASMERFTRSRSLNAILDSAVALAPVPAATAAASSGHVASGPAASASPTANADSIPRYAPRARRVPLPKAQLAIAGLYVLTADDGGVAPLLAACIGKAGGKAVVIPVTAASDPAALASTLDGLRQQHGKVSGIVHLATLDSADTSELAAWKQQSTRQAKALFWLLQQTMADLGRGPSVALAASRFGGSLGRETEGSSLPQAGAAVGLFNCATQEIPSLRARLVDFAADASAQVIVDALMDELAADDARTEIGYVDGVRYGYTHAAEPVSDHPFAPHLTPSGDWVVLISGGARGITAEIAEQMVRPGMRLVLLGRSALPGIESPATASIVGEADLKKTLLAQALAAGRKPTPVELSRELSSLLANREILGNIAKLSKAGATVDYRTCDVRDPAAFGALIDAIYARYGRIDAVIHGAGVIEDKRIPDKTPDSFDRVYDTKVDSAWTLAQKLRPDSLQLLALFTSVSGRFGNTGQSDYAAANETLNRLAWQLHRQWNGVRVISINWGPWDAGMASQQVRDAFRARKITPIPVAAGRRWFMDELAFGPRKDVELVAGEGPWDQDRGAPAIDDNASAVADSTALPLIPRPVRMGAGGAVVYEHSLSLRADPYLGDHRLDNKPVMPAATALEYIAQFAQAAWPEWTVAEIRDLRAFSGIVLDHDGAEKTLLLKARSSTHSDAGSQAATIELFEQGRKAPNYRASVILLPKLPEPPQVAVTPLTDGEPMNTTRMYAEHLFHGPQFQLVTEVASMSMTGIDATVVATSPGSMLGTAEAASTRWLFDFGLVDCGPQLVLVWSRVMHGKTALPSSFGKVVRYGSQPVVGPVTVAIRMKPAAHESGVRYDMQFIDGAGRLRMAFIDAESTMSAALNRLAGNS